MIQLAFYKGRAARRWHRVQDAAIRIRTGGIYSHVEIVDGPAAVLGANVVCLSASGRDGGVRQKVISLRPSAWDLVSVDGGDLDPQGFIRARIGAPYDYWGIIFAQLVPAGVHHRGRWFCSEICAAALGIDAAHRFSPQSLFDYLSA